MPNTKITIRLATVDDLQDVQVCARAAYAKYIDRMDQVPAPMVVNFARQINLGQVYVALRSLSFVGYVVFYAQRHHIHLENVAVVPSQSGQGIGRALVEYVEAVAREKGFDSVELYTNEVMTENLAMYPYWGYKEIDRKPQAGFNRVFFRKSIAPV